jgi:BON domain
VAVLGLFSQFLRLARRLHLRFSVVAFPSFFSNGVAQYEMLLSHHTITTTRSLSRHFNQEPFAMTSTTELTSFHAPDLFTRIGIALTRQQRPALRKLDYRIEQTNVTLSGTVTSVYERQLAVTVVSKVAGVTRVVDELQIPESNTTNAPAKSVELSVPKNTSWSAASILGSATLSIALLAVLVGCGFSSGTPLQPVAGQITWNGQPLAQAFVTLHPRDKSAPHLLPARATTDAQGKFQVTTHHTHDGVAPGEYAVTVVHYPLVNDGQSISAGANSLAPQLAKPETTDIVVQVAAGTHTLAPLDVKR